VRVTGTAAVYGTDQLDEAVVVDPSLTADLPGIEDRYLLVRFAPGVDVAAATTSVGRRAGIELQAVDAPSAVDRMREIGGLPIVLVGFVATLALLTVGHAMLASVDRTRRDLATLRALGMTRRQVSRMLLVQALVVAAAAALIGLPLGVAIGRQVFEVVAGAIGALGAPVASFRGMALGVLGALLVALALAVVASLRIRPFGWAADLRGD
jgi:predicted lysophospholipase L1 biosynthesis ABC-type transport system permease subunit